MCQSDTAVGRVLTLIATAYVVSMLGGCGGAVSPDTKTPPLIPALQPQPVVTPISPVLAEKAAHSAGGTATLTVEAQGTIGHGVSLTVYINGQETVTFATWGSAGTSKNSLFEIAKEGNNELKLKTTLWQGTTNEKTVRFVALPGSVTNAVVTSGSDTFFQNTTIDVKIK